MRNLPRPPFQLRYPAFEGYTFNPSRAPCEGYERKPVTPHTKWKGIIRDRMLCSCFFTFSSSWSTRLYIIRHVSALMITPLQVVQYLRLYPGVTHKLTHGEEKVNKGLETHSSPSSQHHTKERHRKIQEDIFLPPTSLTGPELAYVWSYFTPYSLSQRVAYNVLRHPWMMWPWTRWEPYAVLRLSIYSTLRFHAWGKHEEKAYETLKMERCVSAMLCVLANLPGQWVFEQLPWLSETPLKRTVESEELRPFFYRCGIQLLRARRAHESKTGRTSFKDTDVSSGGGIPTREPLLDAITTANVLALGKPINFLTSQQILLRRGIVKPHTAFCMAYLTCWALGDEDFAALLEGKSRKASLEEMMIHAHELYLMHLEATDRNDAFSTWNVELYSTLLQAWYTLGVIREAWAHLTRALFVRRLSLPVHVLWVGLDLRNHLHPPEPTIPSKDYLELLRYVYTSYIINSRLTPFTERDIRLLSKLAESIQKHTTLFLSCVDSNPIHSWISASRQYWPLTGQYTPIPRLSVPCAEGSLSPFTGPDGVPISNHNCALFVSLSLSLCSHPKLEDDSAKLVGVFAEIGICHLVQPCRMILIYLLNTGWIRLALAVYECLPKSLRHELMHELSREKLEKLYYVLLTSRRGDAIRVRRMITRKTIEEKIKLEKGEVAFPPEMVNVKPRYLSVVFRRVTPQAKDLRIRPEEVKALNRLTQPRTAHIPLGLKQEPKGELPTNTCSSRPEAST